MNDVSRADSPLYSIEFSPWVRRAALVLLVVFLVAPAFAFFAPWQQYVKGTGNVAAFTPLDRPQVVQAPVRGRVVEVFVTESTEVSKGDPLVRIVDIDPEKVARLEAKLDAARSDLEYTEMSIAAFRSQVGILEQARDLAVTAFRARVDVATEKLRAAEQDRIGAAAEIEFAWEQERRMARLAPEFVEQLKLLEATARRKKAEAELERAVADVEGAKAGLADAEAQLGKEREVANAKVEDVRSKMLNESRKAADTRARIADLEGELRAQNTQLVLAPRDGRVFRLRVNTDSSIVSAGEELLKIVPATSRPAVELWVRGVDAPLIQPGRKVRLQFEGWPAVQFMGWPSVAVGTFGGVVALVDPTDSGNGRFRLLVVPDEDDPPWPDERWLRQGARTKGWVLLNEVRLWFELWRQLNGFPPVVAPSEAAAEEFGRLVPR